MTDAHRLVGGWRLRSWVSVADDGAEVHPMGEAPEGLLAYTADGMMVGIMGPGDRPRFATDDLTGGTPEEQSAAFATCIAYGGRYVVDGDTVIHTVEASLFPNWVGTEQRRRFALSDDGRTMTLTSPPIVLRGTRRVQRLTWSRVEVSD